VLRILVRPPRGPGVALLAPLLCICLALGLGMTRAIATPSLPELRAKAEQLRGRLDAQNQRLETIAEDLDAAYARGTKLLAESTALAKRRDAAQRAVIGARRTGPARRASRRTAPGSTPSTSRWAVA
jgi:hypothetical protein